VTYKFRLHEGIDLAGSGRITPEDAERQMTTAKEILARLRKRPGLILADEVGMGKTYVSLAVAASVSLNDKARRPVVVMVPPSLKEKWPKDFQLFRERCLSPEASDRLTFASADRAVDFLKLLDDPLSTRKSLIFLTHGAMSPSRKLSDHWVKLAVIRRAIYRRKDIDGLRRALYRFSGELLRKGEITRKNPKVWEALLNSDPDDWYDVLCKCGLPPADDDDPVPESVLRALERQDLTVLFNTLRNWMPQKRSKYFEENLKRARGAIDAQISELWKNCIRELQFRLPLLILDEAHHLKNPDTQLASLFRSEKAVADAEEVSRGPLAGVFERMLFLTATPFQLGHHELCSVLERFNGISWRKKTAPPAGQEEFNKELDRILKALDSAQEAAVRLDNSWGRLQEEDLVVEEESFDSTEEWWAAASADGNKLTKRGQQVLERIEDTRVRMKVAEKELKPYVIRHMLPKNLTGEYCSVPRRLRYSGDAIENGEPGEHTAGLPVAGESLLPFLLAARVAVLNPDARPVFAEGLSSSYEAFMHTRIQRLERAGSKSLTDGDDDSSSIEPEDSIATWYLDQLQESIPDDAEEARGSHPKVAPVVTKTVELWKKGEKIIIFCHYIATGKILRQQVSEALDFEINRTAAQKMGCALKDVLGEFEKIGKRFDRDNRVGRGLEHEVRLLLKGYRTLEPLADDIVEIARRYVRTPSFLVRYFPLEEGPPDRAAVTKAFKTKDASGMTLEGMLHFFFEFLDRHCGEAEREQYLEALYSVQTGTHYGRDVLASFGSDEVQGDTGRLLPNVRLANGATKQETRQRLMLTFNTPFYPEVLVASAIMAEGVDLHLNCRHIIHHDLCWNPSTLEQRTGRVDRIGAKAERCGQSIQVYLPYIAETQDEKMYRVVMDRERWFKIVMGERYSMDVNTTDKLAERLPFPEAAANSLMLDLRVWEPKKNVKDTTKVQEVST
jgi:ERCC4-related helicase